MSGFRPDWQLPRGVSRGLWDYLHDPDIACGYDASLASSSLAGVDVAFCQRIFDRPGRLVDLGCGTGRLLVPFARRGYWVLGVDLSEEMLKQAAGKADAAGVQIHRLQANLVDLAGLADRSFDYAACLFSTLGMIAGDAERQQALKHVYRILRPGGKFVLHVHNRWFDLWTWQGRKWLIEDLVRSVLLRQGSGDRLMPVHQGIVGLSLHLFRRREIVGLLRDAGFRIREIRPVSLQRDGRLILPALWPWARAYGYLIAAERDASSPAP
jgi:SAM-dependent methyltransferase